MRSILGSNPFLVMTYILFAPSPPPPSHIVVIFLCFPAFLYKETAQDSRTGCYKIRFFILLHEKCLQFDWLRAVEFQLNLKYLDVKITNLLWVVV